MHAHRILGFYIGVEILMLNRKDLRKNVSVPFSHRMKVVTIFIINAGWLIMCSAVQGVRVLDTKIGSCIMEACCSQ
jgi:hypothetical protein